MVNFCAKPRRRPCKLLAASLMSKATRTSVAYKPLPFADPVSNYRPLPGLPLDCMTSVPSLNTYFTRVNLNGLPVTSSS